jgi:amino acid permease
VAIKRSLSRIILVSFQGGGVLSLPYAFSQAGVILGTILLVVTALASDYSAFILVAASRRGNAHTYEDVACLAFGPKGRIASQILVICLTYLALIAYSILLLDLVVPAFAQYIPSLSMGVSPAEASSNFALKLLVGGPLELIILPFAFVESFSKLKFLSVLCVASITLVAVAVFVHFGGCLKNGVPDDLDGLVGDNDDERKHLLHDIMFPPNGIMGVVNALPVFVCTFICHFNMLPVHAELRNPSRARLHTTVHGTIGWGEFTHLIL